MDDVIGPQHTPTHVGTLAIRLLAVMLLSASAGTVVGQEDTHAARRDRLEDLTPAEKEALNRKRDRFYSLSGDEKKRLRDLHKQISSDPQADELEEVMLRYHAWLTSLPSARRAELAGMPAEQRIAEITKMLQQQERQRFEELVVNALQPRDYDRILDWFDEQVRRIEPELLSKLPGSVRDRIPDFGNPRQRRFTILQMLRRQTGDDAESPLEMLSLKDEEIRSLAQQLSEQARAAFDKAEDAEARRLILSNWFRAAIFNKMLPRVSDEELQSYLQEKVDPQLRDYLENLPHERMLSELRRLWYVDRFRRGPGEPGRYSPRKRRPGDFQGPPRPPPPQGRPY
jgi:hypothetical protein